MVHEWYHQLEAEGLSDVVRAIFYANDGHLYSNDAEALHQTTELIVELFERMGLKSSPTKTKAMVCTPQPSVTRICTPAYKRRMGGDGAPDFTYNERKRQQIECDICQASVQARNIVHRKCIKHGIDISITANQTTPLHLTNHGTTYNISMPDYKQPGQCPVPESIYYSDTITIQS